MIFQLQLAHPELQQWRFHKFGKFFFANGTISRCINVSEERLHLGQEVQGGAQAQQKL